MKSGTLQNACSTRPRVVADLGEKCYYAHRQVDEQPSKRSGKNDDKSAVAMLKKQDLYENYWQPVVNRDKSHERSGVSRCLPQHMSRAPRTFCECLLVKYTTIGLRIPGYGAPEVFIDFTEELRHTETNPKCKIHEGHCTSH